MAALLSVIVNIIGFDASKPINCQVSSRPASAVFSLSLTVYDLKVWITFELVSTSNIREKACSALNAYFRFSLTSPLLRLCCWSRSARTSSIRHDIFPGQGTHWYFQCRSLEQEENYLHDHKQHMVDQLFIPYPRRVRPTDDWELQSLINVV